MERSRYSIGLALSLLMFVACGQDNSEQNHSMSVVRKGQCAMNFEESRESAQEDFSTRAGTTYPQRWIVNFRSRIRLAKMEVFANSNLKMERIDNHSLVLQLKNKEGLKNAENFIGRFGSRIQFVEEDVEVEGLATDFGDIEKGPQWHHKQIGTSKAWSITEGGPEVVVAVIDTGVDFGHPELRDRKWINPKEKPNGIDDDGNGLVDDLNGWNYVNNKGNTKPTQQLRGAYHGTHVAGIIAGSRSLKGHSGVAPAIKIMALRFLNDDKSGYTSNGIKAIHYALDNGADVINLSWGSYRRSTKLIEALRRAENQGVLVIAAAGNYGYNNDEKPFYPASYNFSNLISVGASGKTGGYLSSINFGKNSVDIAAPGQSVLSTARQGNYDSRSGSSMAAPMVAGIGALLYSLAPDLNGIQIKHLLLNGADIDRRLYHRVINGRRASARGAVDILVDHLTNGISVPSEKIDGSIESCLPTG